MKRFPLLRRAGRWVLRLTLVLCGLIAVYFLAVLILMVTPANRSFQEPSEGIDIFVFTNGVHTDIVVPGDPAWMEWLGEDPDGVPPAYYSFGWGDRRFFLETPEWSDLTVPVAFQALAGTGTSLMHVERFSLPPSLDDTCRRIRLSKTQLARLSAALRQGFKTGQDGRTILLSAPGYRFSDTFYEGRGAYSAIQTCKTWTGSALREAGVKVSLWTPFQSGVFYHLPAHN